MADLTFVDEHGVPQKWHDNADGTWSKQVYTGAAGGGGDASAANQATQITAANLTNTSLGATTDAVVAAGASGSIAAKLRAISRDIVANIVLAAGGNVIGKVGIDQTTPGTTNLVALAANQSVNNAQINGVAPSMGNGVSGTGVQRVTLASDGTGVVTANGGTPITAATASITRTNDTASSVTVLASNAARKGCILYNDSTQGVKVKFGATASATSFSVYLAAGGTYEMPGQSIYSGIIDAIWDADASGAMNATEW